MTTKPQTFRLTDEDDARNEALAERLGCSKTEVIRKALIALPIAIDEEHYNFDWSFGPGLVLKYTIDKDKNVGTTTWYRLGEGDHLIQIGEETGPVLVATGPDGA